MSFVLSKTGVYTPGGQEASHSWTGAGSARHEGTYSCAGALPCLATAAHCSCTSSFPHHPSRAWCLHGSGASCMRLRTGRAVVAGALSVAQGCRSLGPREQVLHAQWLQEGCAARGGALCVRGTERAGCAACPARPGRIAGMGCAASTSPDARRVRRAVRLRTP